VKGENMDDKTSAKQTNQEKWEEAVLQKWRMKDSWFSWNTPVGLGTLYALVVISTGIFLWLKARS
jgi:hypothetical protein